MASQEGSAPLGAFAFPLLSLPFKRFSTFLFFSPTNKLIGLHFMSTVHSSLQLFIFPYLFTDNFLIFNFCSVMLKESQITQWQLLVLFWEVHSWATYAISCLCRLQAIQTVLKRHLSSSAVLHLNLQKHLLSAIFSVNR